MNRSWSFGQLQSINIMHLFTSGLGAALFAVIAATGAAEVRVDADDQTAISLTVYDQDLALVRDRRSIALTNGETDLAFADVSARIRPETAVLYGELAVLEQNFDYDLLTPEQLLAKFVGREIGLVRTHPQTGEEKRESATLLSVANGGVVFRFGDRIETGGLGSPWRYVFDEVPSNLRERPTLSMLVAHAGEAQRDVELAYLTGGLSWQADYIATLQDDGAHFDLSAWVTATNTSGVSYRNARLQFVAGQLNLLATPGPEAMQTMVKMVDAPPTMERESLFEYHLYTLPRTTTLRDQQAKQLLLLQASGVPVTTRYRIDVSGPVHGPQYDTREGRAETLLTFENEAPALGQPLPAGVIRFYRRDANGSAHFIGENYIDHTPVGRELDLIVGSAFDITSETRQTRFEKGIGTERTSDWEVVVYNAKQNPITVQLQARFPADWAIEQESQPHDKPDAATALWSLLVPESGNAKLSYRVHVR